MQNPLVSPLPGPLGNGDFIPAMQNPRVSPLPGPLGNGETNPAMQNPRVSPLPGPLGAVTRVRWGQVTGNDE